MKRLTIKRAMILVAVAAIPLSLFERYIRFTRLAGEHRAQVGFYIEFDEDLGRTVYITSDRMYIPERVHRWHELLVKKYERAARFPWLPVERDPPEPK